MAAVHTPRVRMKRIWQSVRQVREYYPRVLKLVWHASPRYAFLTLMLSMVSSVVPAAQVWMSKVIIDRVAESFQAYNRGVSFDWVVVITPIVVIFVIWVIGGLCQSMASGVSEQMAFQVRNYAGYLVLKKASELDIAFYETPGFYDQMEKARAENYRSSNLAHLSINVFSSFLTLGAMLALLSHLHPLAVVVLLVTSAPQVIVGGYYAGRRFTLVSDSTAAQRMSFYMSRLLGSREAVKEIRLFGLHGEFLKRYLDFWERFTSDSKLLRFAQERISLLFRLLSMMGTAVIWAYAAISAASGHITIGDVALVFQAAESSRGGLSSLFQNLGLFYEHTIFAGNLFRFLDLSPDSVEGALARRIPKEGDVPLIPKLIQDGIEFRNVSFRYPKSDRFILKNVSFKIKVGETVAIVGENGSGKTTLVKLIIRFYDPTEGTIYLDGRDLRDYDPDSLYREIGVIFQDFVRYDLSAQENIGFGQVEFVNDLERIARAADQGGAREVIDKLPCGISTILGKTFDKGVDLSGGEWQKLALSRAFMRDAQILILDEPTAALDALAEYEIYKRFADLTSDKMTIFISHRFSTVKVAQHILVLQDGQLIEEGTHEELMTRDGQYARMFNVQAERYR